MNNSSNLYIATEERDKMIAKQQEHFATQQKLEREKQLSVASLDAALRFQQYSECTVEEVFEFAVLALKFLKGEYNAEE